VRRDARIAKARLRDILQLVLEPRLNRHLFPIRRFLRLVDVMSLDDYTEDEDPWPLSSHARASAAEVCDRRYVRRNSCADEERLWIALVAGQLRRAKRVVSEKSVVGLGR